MMHRRLFAPLAAAALAALSAVSAEAACFEGRDHRGAPATLRLAVERAGRIAEIHGVLASPNIGAMRIKADYGSGAGRAFYRHEYETGAIFVTLRPSSGQGVVLEADGYGRFPFRAAAC
jgi:hypothetical protein